MTYTEKDGRVTLEMAHADYQRLLLILGVAVGTAAGSATATEAEPDWKFFRGIVNFVNDLNATNPKFRPYAIPGDIPGAVQ